jgi:hypothetical protein
MRGIMRIFNFSSDLRAVILISLMIIVALESEIWVVYALSNARKVYSNSCPGMDICVPLCCHVCRLEGLLRAGPRPRKPIDCV